MGIITQERLNIGFEKNYKAPDRRISEFLRPSERISSPTLLSLNTGPWLHELSKINGRQIYLDEAIFQSGIPIDTDLVWFLGMWPQTKEVIDFGKRWTYQYKNAIGDIKADDVRGSPYAIAGYDRLNLQYIRGWKEWDKMRSKLDRRGVGVYLDFIPNHVGIGHKWTREHPEYFIHRWGRQIMPNCGFTWQIGSEGGIEIAHARDPNYRFWEDTLQLNYANPDLQEAMIRGLLFVAGHSDGVRVDMAMLETPQTFLRTWGSYLSYDEQKYLINQMKSGRTFWKNAIERVKKIYPNFKFIAEAYWEEDILLENGFDNLYAKEDLYNMMVQVRGGLSPKYLENYLRSLNQAQLSHQVRFLENHDELRAAPVFGKEALPAFEMVIAMMPGGLNMIHYGEHFGWQIKTPIQVQRYPDESPDQGIFSFYNRKNMLKHSKLVQEGDWWIPDYTNFNGTMIIQQYVHKMGILSICANLSPYDSYGILYSLGKGSISVYDIVNNFTLPEEIIDRNISDGFDIKLPPWGVQVIMQGR